MKKILIITSKTDEHADYIIQKCNALKFDNVIRFNTEDFFDNISTSFDGDCINVDIKDSGKSFSTGEVSTVWYRRPVIPDLSAYKDEGIIKFMKEQYNAFMNGLYYITHDSALWINDLRKALIAKNKIYQLKLAKEIGFSVPDILISNDYDKIISFYETHKVVCNKSLDMPKYTINGEPYSYMTRLVKDIDEIKQNRESIELCPSLFEEYLDKLYDIRVVIFGHYLYAFEIHSQDNELSKIDVRGVDPERLIHKEHKLPDYIVNMIRDFMKRQGLVFSSMDLILTKCGDYYFIENNVNGQWLWLEYMTSCDMSSDFINFINEHK